MQSKAEHNNYSFPNRLPRCNRRQGFILLLILAVLSVLILMVINLLEVVQLERELSNDALAKTRSRLLARSGVEYSLAFLNEVDLSLKAPLELDNNRVIVGTGTFSRNGDEVIVGATDASSKINVNDGIEAGQLEEAHDRGRGITVPWEYDSTELDPWPDANVVLNLQDKSSGGTLNKSGLLNLRVRRLLNAYGDAHIYVDELGNTPTWGSLGGFTFSSTAAGDRGVSAAVLSAGPKGFGDVIIENRPNMGYNSVEEIRVLINAWAATHISVSHYSTSPYNFDSFFDMVTPDITVASFEDKNFYRLRTETAATLDSTDPDNPYNSALSAHMWHYQNDHTDSRFHPNYLDRHPIDLSDDSGNSVAGASPQENKLWAPHSVSLINMNGAGYFVRAAVFYAPVNVSYLCESAVTHSVRSADKNLTSPNWTMTPGDKIIEFAKDLGMARSSIGVRGPCFELSLMTENGVPVSAGADKVQKNRLMSLTDALTLADHYNSYLTATDIYNFEDFKSYLIDFRKSRASAGQRVYERAIQIPLKSDWVYDGAAATGYLADRVKKIYGIDFVSGDPKPGDVDFDPDREEALWVSQYWEDVANSGDYVGGWFLNDYVERTLPHIFSCVRRIPGYLGAPMALTSPYMVVEPFAYKADPKTMGRHDVSDADRTTFEANYNANHTAHSNPAIKYLGRQPKISVEDLVTRHTLPKISFMPGGVYDFISQGNVWADSHQLVARTTIRVSMEMFKTKFYRTQSDFVKLLKTGIGSGADQTHGDIVFGPEFKLLNATQALNTVTPQDRVVSKYWGSFGLADANSQSNPAKPDPSDNVDWNFSRMNGHDSSGNPQFTTAGSDDTVKGWDLYMSGDVRRAGALAQDPNIDTFLPSYGSMDGFFGASDGWQSLFDDSLTNRTHPPIVGVYLGWPFPLASTTFLATKSEARKRVPLGSSILKTGGMEEANDVLWATSDGHDADPFGQGIFFGASGQGEYADADPLAHDPANFKHPSTFRDSMYWNLNNKLKNWSVLTGDGAGGLNTAAVDNNGKYKFAVDINNGTIGEVGPFTDGDDVNPVGLSFHRSFFAAWFRIPTAYPFAQPVSLTNANNASPDTVADKVKLFRCIMSLNFRSLDDWSQNRSPILTEKPWARPYSGNGSGVFDGGHSYQIQVGYYSGFDNDYTATDFEFEQGVVGRFIARPFNRGLENPSPSTSRWSDGNHNHPSYFKPKLITHNYKYWQYTGFGVNAIPDHGSPTTSGNPYFGKVHGYSWDYDHLFPTPFHFDDILKFDSSLPDLKAPPWGGGSSHLGYLWQANFINQGGDNNKFNFVPISNIGWMQDMGNTQPLHTYHADQSGSYSLFYGYETDTARYITDYGYKLSAFLLDDYFKYPDYGFLPGSPPLQYRIPGYWPQTNLMYLSKGQTSIYGPRPSQVITHQLRMNNTPECGPGSWHRIYAFWFLRQNSGAMGLDIRVNLDDAVVAAADKEKGDSELYGGSYWWDERNYNTYHSAQGTVFDRGDPNIALDGYPEAPTIVNYLLNPIRMYLPHGGSSLEPGFNPNMVAAFPRNAGSGSYYEKPNDQEGLNALTSRYAKDDEAIARTQGHYNTDAAFDVDGLDQFGIWFRDDSNYTDYCNTSLSVKPKWDYYWDTPQDMGRGPNSRYVWRNHLYGATLLSIGDMQLRKVVTYTPRSGEGPYPPANFTMPYSFSYPNDRYSHPQKADYLWKHYPGYRFESSIDDIIFGYGSDISVPGQSYFRGLFHNANWLASMSGKSDTNIFANHHPDEVRYDVRQEQRMNLQLMDNTLTDNDMPVDAALMHAACRIYRPRDSNYNYSDLSFSVHGATAVVSPILKPSLNNQNYFYYPSVENDSLRYQLQYLNKKPALAGATALQIQSTIFNYNQDVNGLPSDDPSTLIHTFDGGDSFTNIPHVQELSLQYKVGGEYRQLKWVQN